jgi:Yip1-like protein
MEIVQQSPRLADLFTILYRPRETMRRILDGGRDRWAVQVVLLAYVCASVNDTDAYRLGEVLPGVKVLPLMAIVALALVVGAATWVVALLIVSWIAAPVGRMLGGVGTAADIRAALGWGIAPIVWSPIYRIPFIAFQSRFPLGSHLNVRETLLDFAARGGCSMIVIFLGLQLLFFLWSLIVASCNLAEAQRFSSEKGFVNVVISIALPLMVIGAAVYTFSK